MKIHSISVCNINSLKGNFTIDFTKQPLQDCGLFAITGPTGAGKTTLLDALTLALYGDVARMSDATGVMSYGCGECWAEVVFQTAKGAYKAKWSAHRAHKRADGDFQAAKRELAEWPSGNIISTKAREVEQNIQEIIGLTKDQFLKSVLLAQGDFTAFLKAKPNERADILEKMTSTEMYRTLSRRAFEKKKAEESVMQRLNDLLQGIQILSSEEEANKQQALEQAQSVAQTIGGERAERLEDQKWIEALDNLRADFVRAEQAHNDARLRREHEAETFRKWQAHQQVISFEAAILLWQKSHGEIDVLTNAIEVLQAAIAMLQQKEEVVANESLQAHNAYKVTKELLERHRPILQNAITESQLLQADERRVNELNGEIESKSEQLAEAKRRLAKNELELADTITSLDKINTWLTEHQTDGTLESVISKCRGQLQTLTALRERADGHKKEINNHNTALAGATQRVQESETRLQEGEEGIAKLASHKETLSERLAQWHCFAKQSKANQESGLRKTIASLQQLSEQIARKEIFIAHYNSLKEGEPCPLCGSSEHPNTSHDINSVEVELATLKNEQTQIQNTEKQQSKSLREAELLIQSLSEIPEATVYSSDFTEANTKEVDEQLKLFRKVPAQEGIFVESQRNAVKQKVSAQADQIDADTALRAAKEALDALTLDGKKVAAFFTATATQYQASFATGREQALINTLELRLKEFGRSAQEAEKLSATLPDKKAGLENEKNNIDGIEREIAAKRKISVEVSEAVGKKAKGIRETFPNGFPSPEAFLESLGSKEAAAQAAARKADEALQAVKGQVNSQQAILQSKEEDLKEKTSSFKIDEAHLSEELTGMGLSPDISKAAVQLLDTSKRVAVERLVREIELEVNTTSQKERDCKEALRAHEATPRTVASKEDIFAAVASLEEKLSAANQNIGALQNELRVNADAKERLRGVESQIAVQQIEVRRWQELSSLIGSSNGDAFARFAQTISLEQLLHFANEHLRGLSDRYQLCCNADNPEDLKLMVEDGQLAGSIRDTKTLSGGESFLVSLGLALGLAEMASQSTRIDSLFIDEGFGTLDEAALDDAITTLEGLQARGKKIGVISHVEQLKERIQTQVVVSKRGNGYSDVSVSPALQ